MRAAPPVQMICGPDRQWAAAVALPAGLAAGVTLHWVCWHAGLGLVPALAATAVAALGAGAWAWRRTLRVPARTLGWDGSVWRLDARPGSVIPKLEVGDWRLLYWRDEGGACWLPLSLSRCGAPAHLARAALRAHALPRLSHRGDGLERHG